MIDQEQVFDYLDELRESGIVNMDGAGAYVERTFKINKKQAQWLVAEWMRTFTQRHPA